MEDPLLPPYPDTVAPVGAIGEPLSFVITVVTLFAAVLIVFTLLRASQKSNGTDEKSARTQTIVAAGVTAGVVLALNAIVVGAINSAAVESARQANFDNILAYNRQYAAAIGKEYGIDISADEANALLSGVSVDTALPDGSSVSIVLVDEFEPELGILDADTEQPIPPLAG